MKLSVDYDKLNPEVILEMMKQGLKIEFPTGYYISGDPSTKYIEMGHQFGSDGLWDMTLEGVKNAINDAKNYEIEELKAQAQ